MPLSRPTKQNATLQDTVRRPDNCVSRLRLVLHLVLLSYWDSTVPAHHPKIDLRRLPGSNLLLEQHRVAVGYGSFPVVSTLQVSTISMHVALCRSGDWQLDSDTRQIEHIPNHKLVCDLRHIP